MRKIDGACVYCGEPAEELDHVPPKKWRPTLVKNGVALFVFKVVPACRSCNNICGGRPLFTVEERRAFIRGELWRKNAKLILSPGWHEGEIKQLGRGLRSYVKRRQSERAKLLRRVGMARG